MGDVVGFDAGQRRSREGGVVVPSTVVRPEPEAWRNPAASVRRVFEPRPRQAQVATPFLAMQASKLAEQLTAFVEAHAQGRQAKQVQGPEDSAYGTAIGRLEKLSGMMRSLQDRAMAMEGRERLQDHLWATCGAMDDALKDLRRQKEVSGVFVPDLLAGALAQARGDLAAFLPQRGKGLER